MKRSAFTLIELLVVIAIVAILAAILFPVYSRAKASAKNIKEVVQARQIGMSVSLYLADHDNGTDKIDPTKPSPKHGEMKVYRFRLDENGLVKGKRKTIVDFGEEAGCDGMTVDGQGNVYLTSRSLKRPGVLVVNPHGKEIAFIPTGPKNQKVDETHPPQGLPSNVEFGIGKEIHVLDMTVDVSLYRIRLKSHGFHRQYRHR